MHVLPTKCDVIRFFKGSKRLNPTLLILLLEKKMYLSSVFDSNKSRLSVVNSLLCKNNSSSFVKLSMATCLIPCKWHKVITKPLRLG